MDTVYFFQSANSLTLNAVYINTVHRDNLSAITKYSKSTSFKSGTNLQDPVLVIGRLLSQQRPVNKTFRQPNRLTGLLSS